MQCKSIQGEYKACGYSGQTKLQIAKNVYFFVYLSSWEILESPTFFYIVTSNDVFNFVWS